MGWCPLQDLPSHLVVLVVLLQLPDVGAEPGVVLISGVSKVSLMLIPSLLESVASEPSVVLHPRS